MIDIYASLICSGVIFNLLAMYLQIPVKSRVQLEEALKMKVIFIKLIHGINLKTKI